MPRHNDIKKVRIIRSGPIVIGQTCEFGYSGIQVVTGLLNNLLAHVAEKVGTPKDMALRMGV
ncbi:MAG: hypothetical protein JXA17_08465 [Dehalococcoidales bacterium]|nr:hypothetical protein [Dehalococcoidales bacterium]